MWAPLKQPSAALAHTIELAHNNNDGQQIDNRDSTFEETEYRIQRHAVQNGRFL